MAGLSTDTFDRLLAIVKGDDCVRVPVGDEFALVDAADAEIVLSHTWARSSGYAVTGPHGSRAQMHRMILGVVSPKVEVDHIDGDGMNNQRHNLRICTRSQNAKNRHSAFGSSRFKGVWMDRGSWRASIWCDGKKRSLGSFVSERKAARAYDEAARELHGEFACTNEDLGLY